jgi:tRNA threonylcarbamoyladenosine biosynthesis protein TsaE
MQKVGITTKKAIGEALNTEEFICNSPQETFELGEEFAKTLLGGEIILLFGGLGVGKTLLTKGILNALDYDVDEVTSPSFTLVNRYDARFTVYHIDLWRIENNAEFAVGLHEILEEEKSVVIIEWSERLKSLDFGRKTYRIEILGDGDDQRSIKIINETNYQ